MDADGSDPRRLTDHPEFDGRPTWSPDGSRIAFCSHRDGRYQVYVVPADGGAVPVNLTDSESDDCYPAWSPIP